jgi:hypothetical protein
MSLEIQLLDSDGRALEIARLDEDSNEAVLGGVPVPQAVIDAARRRALRDGDYVNELGESVPPF